MSDFTNTVDFGVGLGATYNITENAFVQARYTLGLTNVFEDNLLTEFTDFDKAKNGTIQVAFGWKF